jgi:tetratricopeptide (TPR) repeat protein
MKTRINALLPTLLLAALFIKLGYLLYAMAEPNSVADLSVDELFHYRWASLIASGEILANAPYFRAPLYPFLLAALLKISGDGLIFIRLMQLLAGILTLIFAYKIAFKVAGKKVAILTFLLLLFYPMTTYFEGELLLDSIFSLFATVSLYLFICRRDGRERPLLAGLFFALAAITRPVILVFLPLIFIYYLSRWRDSSGRKEGVRNLVLFLIMAALLIAPVTIVNFVTSGQFILISYQGGVNFYIGNNSEADGLSSTLPAVGKDWELEDTDYLANQESGRNLAYGEQSLFWYQKGLDYIVANPGKSLGLFVRKFYYLFSGHEVSNNRPLDEVVFQNPLLSYLPVRFSLIASLAILPLFLVRDNRKLLYSLYGLILIYGITVSLFFVSSRFRLPMVPLMTVMAGWGIATLWNEIRARQFGNCLFSGIICAILIFILASSSIFPISLVNREQSLFLRGNQSLRRGDFQEAAARFDSLSRTNPRYKNCHLNLGIAYLKMGLADSAAQAFRRELSFNDRSAEAANNLGVIFLLRDENDSARHYCRQALRIKPYYTEAAINFLRSAEGESNPAELNSIDVFRREIRPANFDRPIYVFEEALYFSGLRRLREAIDNHLHILEISSQRPPSISFGITYSNDIIGYDKFRKLACYQLGYLYGLLGEFEPSVRFSRRAVELDPHLKEAYINLISGYRSLGEIGLADSVAADYLSRWPEP